MASADDPWEVLIAGLRAGDQDAARRFCDEFGPALLRIAAHNLPEALRRRVGPEDVVQSACRTFFRRAQGGEFRLTDSETLWQLLCAITLTKVREQARFHLRQKRNLGQEVQALPADSMHSGSGFQPVQAGPSPDEAVAFADQFEQLLSSLGPEERQLVDLKLQELTNEEVAQQMGCSERTVRRILKRVQSRLARAFDLSAQ